MQFSVALLALAGAASAQVISQITDGQIQAPTAATTTIAPKSSTSSMASANIISQITGKTVFYPASSFFY